jgi:LCP family protein required for cell wall assembly
MSKVVKPETAISMIETTANDWELAFMVSRSTTTFLQSSTSTAAKSTGTVISKPYVVYISGIDTYGEVGTTSRSDVNIIAVVNPKDKKVLLVNTPRDYYVQLHGTAGVKDKLTHAGIYGIDMSKNTLQDLYDTKIDYTLRINFTSLLKMIDAVGGIEVQSDVAFSAGGYNFVQGVNSLDSKQALAFARERHSFSEGDRQRGKNQQQVITALISKLSSPSTLVNYQKLLKSLDGTFQTNASSSEVSSLIRQQINSAGAWTTESISVDGSGAKAPTYSMGSQLLYVMEPNQATVDNAVAAIKAYLTTPERSSLPK